MKEKNNFKDHILKIETTVAQVYNNQYFLSRTNKEYYQ